MVALSLVQFLLGMGLNLFVTLSRHHPGTTGSNYFTRSFASVVWGLSHFGLLPIHVGVGIVLFLGGARLAESAFRAPRLRVRTYSVVGALAVLAAGFNGASFLDFNFDLNSMLMAVLFAIATMAFALVAVRAALAQAAEPSG